MTGNVRSAQGSNRHSVDQLGDVRATIRDLQDVEKALKEKVSREMGAKDSLGGDEWIANQRINERKGGLDENAIAAKLGVKNLEAFRKPPTTVVTITTTRRETDEDAVIISREVIH